MQPILRVENLSVNFAQRTAPIAAVRQVSLDVAPGECLGVVGESGSGKTQVFMAVMGLLAGNAVADGSVRFADQDILGLDPERLNRFRGSKLTMIFQDPMTSLTPHIKVGIQLAEVLVAHAGVSWSEARIAARRMLERVQVPEAQRRLNQYPHELSGGLRQRVMIGMSLLCDPSLVVADEPTTALDVTVQAQIIELLREVRVKVGMSLVLISHDLAVVAGLADRILVMYAGRIVESAGADGHLSAPAPSLYRGTAELCAEHRGAALGTAADSYRVSRHGRERCLRLRLRAALRARRRALPGGAAAVARRRHRQPRSHATTPCRHESCCCRSPISEWISVHGRRCTA